MARPFDEYTNLAWNTGYPASIKYGSETGRMRQAKIESSNHGALTAHRRDRPSETSPTFTTMPLPVSKIKIKPLLRKMSNDQQTVDLSKSITENEALGISTSFDISRHKRNVSNTSTATTTSHQRPYIHPMRQTPIAHSFANSVESGSSGPYEDSTQYVPVPSPRRPPPLNIPRHSSTSQTNIPGTPSSLRKQSETPVAMSTRTSFDSIFRKRSRTNTNEDPVARAAQVAILRREFAERERQKEEVRREQENRTVERETKRQQKRDESQQRKSERKNTTSEKDTPSTQTCERPKRSSTKVAGKAAKSQWQLFVFWFKTVLLKMGRGVSRSSD